MKILLQKCLVSSLILFPIGATMAQSVPKSQTIDLGAEPTCATCRIVKERLARFDGEQIDGMTTEMAVDERGRFYRVDRDILQVYGPDGKFIQQIGRHGKGPGEYMMIRNVILDRGGKVHVLDGQLARHSIFDANGKFLSSTSFPTAMAGRAKPAVLLGNGDLLMNLTLVRPQDAGFTVQRVSTRGDRSAMIEETRYSNRTPWMVDRLFATLRNGDVLIGTPWHFTINRYTAALRKTGSIQFVGSWLSPLRVDEEPSYGLFERRPSPSLTGIWEGADGLLWLQMLVESPAWKSGPTQEAFQKLPKDDRSKNWNRTRYDEIVAAVDLKTSRVVALNRGPFTPGAPFGAGYYHTYTEGPDGGEVVAYRFALKR